MTIRWTALPGPLGELTVARDDAGVRGIWYPDHRRGPRRDPSWVESPGAFDDVAEQLAEYFRGVRRTFTLDLAPEGTSFQRAVWAALGNVGYGQTTTYGELAVSVGRPTAARAVAGAVARNPLSIVVACHRVVGADRSLTGYAGGIERKRHLLDLESRTD